MRMADNDKAGNALRLLASRGWAEMDADVVRELLAQAEALAQRVAAGQGASTEARRLAAEMLDTLAAS
jgi:hypothetical protein